MTVPHEPPAVPPVDGGQVPARGLREAMRRAGPALAVLAAVAMGIGLTEPVMALYSLELGASPLQAALVVSVRWITRLVTNVPAGAWSDRHGRRVAILYGTGAIAASGVVAVFATDWRVLLVSRVLEGLGAGALMTAVLAYLSDVTEEDRGTRARLFGWYQMIHRTGFWLGPAAGAALYGLAGGRTVMAGYAVCTVGGFLLALPVRETRGRGGEAGRPTVSTPTWTAVTTLCRRPAFLFAGAMALASFFTLTGAQFTAMPLLVVEELRLGAEALGTSMLVINAVGFALIYPSARAADRHGRRLPVAALALMGAVGLLVLARGETFTSLMGASVLLGGATALRGPALQAFAMDAGDSVGTGVSAGLFRAMGDIGSAAGPMAAGLLAGAGAETFFVLNAGLLGVCAVAFLVGRDVRRYDLASPP